MDSPVPASQPHLERRLTLFPATALNLTNMLGAGPFITIPLLITVPDALVWSELGAALPGSGGTYRWLR